MPTLLEARNEWAEALTAAKNVADNPEAYEKAWESAEKARKTFENLQKSEAAEKALGLPENQVQQMVDATRNPDDAALIKPVNADTANLDPSKFVKVGENIWPVADKNTEGWIKGRAVATQHPDILKRLSPELRNEKAMQETAFAAYLRHGLAWVRKNKPDLIPFLNALQEDTDSEGGYTVPTDQRFEVIHNPGKMGGVTRAISRVFNTTRDGGTFPTATTVTWAGVVDDFEPLVSRDGVTTFRVRVFLEGVQERDQVGLVLPNPCQTVAQVGGERRFLHGLLVAEFRGKPLEDVRVLSGNRAAFDPAFGVLIGHRPDVLANLDELGGVQVRRIGIDRLNQRGVVWVARGIDHLLDLVLREAERLFGGFGLLQVLEGLASLLGGLPCLLIGLGVVRDILGRSESFGPFVACFKQRRHG
jgi:hypothetical protein